MKRNELERLEKNSIHSLRLNNNLKEIVIQNYLNDLSKLVKSRIKKNNVVILIMEED